MRPSPLSFALLALLTLTRAVPAAERAIPRPLPAHPGNVFLAGEPVSVAAPTQDGQPPGEWTLYDYEGRKVTSAAPRDGRLTLGQLPVGWFRLQAPTGPASSVAVLAPLKAPTPAASPVGLDVAMAWFYPKERMDAAASLAALAGVNWVRDRLAWGEMEPRRGQVADSTRYDASARAQADAGLRVLQVNHSSPRWANPATKRFPTDLRDTYRFHKDMARRWQGQVLAFEPWNEADIPVFGGHTGAEMASLQKAAYLGLKAGNPDVTACLNVFAAHRRSQLDDLADNEAWPYFDTFNLHHYAPFAAYPGLYADFRSVSAGRPLWVTECAMPVKWAGDPALQEPNEADLRVQSERVAQVFAGSLHEGSAATFYFLLPHYVEGQTQFGIVRRDLTPRPAYVALAAVGRLLADARPLGRLKDGPDGVQAFAFSARPDGQAGEVLVAWSTKADTKLPLPVEPRAVFDHLGRSEQGARSVALSAAPRFLVLPQGASTRLSLAAPPAAPARLSGLPSPVVLQAIAAEDQVRLDRSAYEVKSNRGEVALFVYNFTDGPAAGRLEVQPPAGWQARLEPAKVDVPALGRVQVKLALEAVPGAVPRAGRARVSSDFGPLGKPVLSVRVLPGAAAPRGQDGPKVAGSAEASRWQASVSGAGDAKVSADQGGIRVEARPAGSDRWVYPRLELATGERAPAGAIGLACTLTIIEGEATFRAVLDEANGSSYVMDFARKPRRGVAVETVARFDDAVHGAVWSREDPNGRLDPGEVRSLKIGCNTQGERVVYRVENLRWLMEP